MELFGLIMLMIVVIVFGRFWYYWREALFLKGMNKIYGSFFHEYSKLPKEKYAHILDPKHPAMKAITSLRRRKSHFLELVKKAGFGEESVMTHERVGFQQYRVDHKVAGLIDNPDPKYISTVMESFDNIIGYYEDRAKESFDPYYWIKLVFNSPSYIMKLLVDGVRYAFAGGK